MKKLLSLGFLCASLIAAPLAAHATQITGTLGVSLTIPNGAPAFVGSTSLSWSAASTQNNGTTDFSVVGGGLPVSGDQTISFVAGTDGHTLITPFTLDFDGLGTFTANTSVYDLSQTSHGELFTITGTFTPDGSLANPGGYTVTSADVFFAMSQSVVQGQTSTTGSFTLSTPSDLVPTVPEPSSLVLLGTGLLGTVGAMRKRFKA